MPWFCKQDKTSNNSSTEESQKDAASKAGSVNENNSSNQDELETDEIDKKKHKEVHSKDLKVSSTDHQGKNDKSYERKWLILQASEAGKSHLAAEPPIPCQDHHAVLQLNEGWGIAVLCDGAGSASFSHIGSKFVANQSAELFKDTIKEYGWMDDNSLPEKDTWKKICLKAFKRLRYDLEVVAKFEEKDVKQLACTIIVVIYSPKGLLCTHIGDGRAGYKDQKSTWRSSLKPHNGEYANQTIFLTSDNWLTGDYSMSGVMVPESRVIKDSPVAFTLMSDGCEYHSFEIGHFNEKQNKFIRKNKPFPGFFEPLIEKIRTMVKEGSKKEEIQKKWSKFIKQGTEGLKNETDDKTLILGITID